MVRWELALAFLGMAGITFVMRALPFFLLSRRQLPPWAETWLGLVGPAVMAALLLPAVLVPDGRRLWVDASNPYLIASVPTLLVALKYKSMVLTVLTGVLFAWAVLHLRCH